MEAVTHVPQCFSLILSPSVIFVLYFLQYKLAEARSVCSDVHSSSISFKLINQADESVTAAAAELWADYLFGMYVWEFSEWGVCLREESAISSSLLVRLSSSIVGENGCLYWHLKARFWLEASLFGGDVWNIGKNVGAGRKNLGAGVEPIRSQQFAGDAFMTQ